MALSQSALSELLDAIRAGGGEDVVREALTLVLQELIELEAAQAIGADRYERTESRQTHRNGSRTRLLSTKAGDVELHIPKLRAGSFFPSLLEPRRRIDRALWAVVMEAYVHGVSTRKVDDLVAALGIVMLGWLPHWSHRLIPELHGEPRAWYVIAGMQRWRVLVVVMGVWILRRFVRALADPTPKRVQIAVSQGILSIVMLDAVACYAVRGVFWAIMILLLLLPAGFLGRRIETT